MSRIGKKAITVPSGVTATIEGQTVTVRGPKAHLSWTVAEEIELVDKVENMGAKLVREAASKTSKIAPSPRSASWKCVVSSSAPSTRLRP